jgi:glycine C-acetyltransferase
VAAAGIKMVEMMTETNYLQDKLHRNSEYFMGEMTSLGFDIKPTKSAICAVMLYDARLSQEFAARLLNEGIYVIGFYFPVRRRGTDKIQLSTAQNEHPRQGYCSIQ